MAKKKVFIDGKAGTTGLRIYERLESFDGIELITLSEEKRKDPEARKEALNSADVAFLCLPDDASRESVSLKERTLAFYQGSPFASRCPARSSSALTAR